MKEGGWDDAVGKTVMNAEFRLFSFNPPLSRVPDEVASLDPEFWHPKAQMAKVPGKQITPAAKKKEEKEQKQKCKAEGTRRSAMCLPPSFQSSLFALHQ